MRDSIAVIVMPYVGAIAPLFKTMDLGTFKYFLDLEITQNQNGINVGQRRTYSTT